MRNYSKKFKESAVNKVLNRGEKTMIELGDEIGVSTHTLRTWRKQFSSGNINSMKSPRQ